MKTNKFTKHLILLVVVCTTFLHAVQVDPPAAGSDSMSNMVHNLELLLASVDNPKLQKFGAENSTTREYYLKKSIETEESVQESPLYVQSLERALADTEQEVKQLEERVRQNGDLKMDGTMEITIKKYNLLKEKLASVHKKVEFEEINKLKEPNPVDSGDTVATSSLVTILAANLEKQCPVSSAEAHVNSSESQAGLTSARLSPEVNLIQVTKSSEVVREEKITEEVKSMPKAQTEKPAKVGENRINSAGTIKSGTIETRSLLSSHDTAETKIRSALKKAPLDSKSSLLKLRQDFGWDHEDRNAETSKEISVSDTAEFDLRNTGKIVEELRQKIETENAKKDGNIEKKSPPVKVVVPGTQVKTLSISSREIEVTKKAHSKSTAICQKTAELMIISKGTVESSEASTAENKVERQTSKSLAAQTIQMQLPFQSFQELKEKINEKLHALKSGPLKPASSGSREVMSEPKTAFLKKETDSGKSSGSDGASSNLSTFSSLYSELAEKLSAVITSSKEVAKPKAITPAEKAQPDLIEFCEVTAAEQIKPAKPLRVEKLKSSGEVMVAATLADRISLIAMMINKDIAELKSKSSTFYFPDPKRLYLFPSTEECMQTEVVAVEYQRHNRENTFADLKREELTPKLKKLQADRDILSREFREIVPLAGRPGKLQHSEEIHDIEGFNPLLELTEHFSENRSLVQIGEKWGFVDKDGAVAVQPLFNDALNFSEGLAPVKLDEKWGYININGELVIPMIYDCVFPFSEGYARIALGSKWGYIDFSGKPVIDPQFEYATDFKDGMAKVELDGIWKYIYTPTKKG
ncbi:MAG: WG repeat-containing protein [Candidatus Wallbacteria bacterium]|nr:WG repeat-containing protein [Candidatus Wallbacteria bacterium]